ncbi:protein eva-1 [Bicyclus anynana]|uniref:Protein eva-1 n=1 Tax=Bicyclus anynana TaxID=110368 RepID=A0A6J1N310_BICAN|nr:protein eva-1 [Bicyclus anynana]
MTSAVFIVFGALLLPGSSLTNSDNLELLVGTLRTNQRAACDDELVSLSCPNHTYISIQVAKYGSMPEGHSCKAKPMNMQLVQRDCLWPTNMQNALLQTIVEACHKKPQCEFSTKIKPGPVDPCPQTVKFVEVAYKCRPRTDEFHSKTVCENDVIELSCNASSRLLIYAAQYGRATHDTPLFCQQPPGVLDESCSAPYALKTTMQICHGKQQCQIVADSKTFGSPCRPESRAYLKVSYTCVPLGVLSERYENSSAEDKVTNHYDINAAEEHFDTPDIAGKWSKSTKNQIFPQTTIHSSSNMNGLEYKDPSTKSSNLKFLIYISIATLIVIILAMIFIGIRYYRNKKRAQNSKNGDMFTTEAPNVFNDAASDLDNDLDVSHISGTFYDPVHPDMILYRDGANKATLRAMRPLNTVYPCAGASMYSNVDYIPSHSRDASTRFGNKEVDSDLMMSPKSLSGYTNSQFYYG